jgi:dihydrofolate reductase
MERTRPYTVAVVAMSPARVIGRDGGLPWHLPEDLRFFRRTTTGTAVLMGRRTWESIGRPLPGRRNLVLSRNPPLLPPGVEALRSPEELDALDIRTRLHVIGGAAIYATMLPRCDEVLVSQLFDEFPGDTWFPPFESEFGPAQIVERHETFEVRRFLRLQPPFRANPASAGD